MRARTIIRLLVLVLFLGGVGFGAWKAYDYAQRLANRERCYVTLDGGAEPLTLTAEQSRNAAIIVAASYKAGLPEQAAVIALATAWQESGLRNLDYGDRDSLGLFQQRPSYGWGTPDEIMDPWYSAGRFYAELVKFDNWESRDITEMAQKVQRSGFPDAYRKHEANAIALAGSLRGTRPATFACIDRTDSPGDAAAFADVVAQVPGVTSSQKGDTVTLKASDTTALWSAMQLALANTRDGGIVAATMPDHSWKQESKAWRDASGRGTAGEATIQLRAQ